MVLIVELTVSEHNEERSDADEEYIEEFNEEEEDAEESEEEEENAESDEDKEPMSNEEYVGKSEASNPWTVRTCSKYSVCCICSNISRTNVD